MFFSFAENTSDKQMVTRLDENRYNENELIQIKFPLNIPYTVSHINYERCDGQLVINGIQYNYVKRSIQNDTMYLYCVPNHAKTALSNTKTEYASQVTDLPSGKKAEHSDIKKNSLSGEYKLPALNYNFSYLLHFRNKSALFNNNSTLPGFPVNPLQPPETI